MGIQGAGREGGGGDGGGARGKKERMEAAGLRRGPEVDGKSQRDDGRRNRGGETGGCAEGEPEFWRGGDAERRDGEAGQGENAQASRAEAPGGCLPFGARFRGRPARAPGA